MKKSVISIILAVILALAFIGCSSQPAGSGNNADGNAKQEAGLYEDNDTSVPENTKTDTGRYVGQIDNNSIEIKISGVPDSIAAKAFRFTEDTASQFKKLDLQKDDQVMFEYYENEDGQNILVKIEKI